MSTTPDTTTPSPQLSFAEAFNQASMMGQEGGSPETPITEPIGGEGAEGSISTPPITPPDNSDPKGGDQGGGSGSEESIADELFYREFARRAGGEYKTLDEYKAKIADEIGNGRPALIRELESFMQGDDGDFDRFIELKKIQGMDLQAMKPEDKVKEWYFRNNPSTDKEALERDFKHWQREEFGQPKDTASLERKIKSLDAEDDEEEIAALQSQLADAKDYNDHREWKIGKRASEADKYLSELKGKISFPDPKAITAQRQEQYTAAMDMFNKGISEAAAKIKELNLGKIVKDDPDFVYSVGPELSPAVEKAKQNVLDLFQKGPLGYFSDDKGNFDFGKALSFFIDKELQSAYLGSIAKRYEEKGKMGILKPHQNPSVTPNGQPFTPSNQSDGKSEMDSFVEKMAKSLPVQPK